MSPGHLFAHVILRLLQICPFMFMLVLIWPWLDRVVPGAKLEFSVVICDLLECGVFLGLKIRVGGIQLMVCMLEFVQAGRHWEALGVEEVKLFVVESLLE